MSASCDGSATGSLEQGLVLEHGSERGPRHEPSKVAGETVIGADPEVEHLEVAESVEHTRRDRIGDSISGPDEEPVGLGSLAHLFEDDAPPFGLTRDVVSSETSARNASKKPRLRR